VAEDDDCSGSRVVFLGGKHPAENGCTPRTGMRSALLCRRDSLWKFRSAEISPRQRRAEMLLREDALPGLQPRDVLWKTMSNGTPNAFSTPAFLEIAQQGGLPKHLGAFSAVGKNLAERNFQSESRAAEPMADLMPVLEYNPFSAGCFRRGRPPGAGAVVILSTPSGHTFRFANGHIRSVSKPGWSTLPVVGRHAPGFHVLSDKELFWVPLQLESVSAQASARNVHWPLRLYPPSPGWHQEQVQAGLDAIATRLKVQDPTGEGGFGATLQPVGDFANGTVKPVLLL